MGIVVIGPTLMDVKGHPFGTYVPAGRNAGRVIEVPGGVARNIASPSSAPLSRVRSANAASARRDKSHYTRARVAALPRLG